MKRRELVRGGVVAALAAGLGACSGERPPAERARFRWKMVTSWPTNFPGLGSAAARLAESITRTSGGRLRVSVHGAGELGPAFEVFDAVARGSAEMGHSAAHYWRSKSAAAPFFCTVPFGFNAQEMNAWLYEGGGLALWRELYAGFGLVPFPAGNTGVQMGGWFRRPLADVAGLKGLKIRMPGLGGEVLARLGATPVNVPGDAIFAALQSGDIDAAEWLGPYNDLAFGLHKAAKYCYYPGWQEPGPTLECIVNAPAFAALPADLQAIVETCCRAANDATLAEFTARNAQALDVLVREHRVELRQLPDDVLLALRRAADHVLEELAAADPLAQRAYDSMRKFMARTRAWHAVSEEAWYNGRGG
jgi:TRAP-type mannitol/chloroaromatic compound transport system substrate-binding protein